MEFTVLGYTICVGDTPPPSDVETEVASVDVGRLIVPTISVGLAIGSAWAFGVPGVAMLTAPVQNAAIGVVAGCLIQAAIQLLVLTPLSVILMEAEKNQRASGDDVSLVDGISAGVFEELLFRGVLQSLLMPLGAIVAVLLPNVLFGMLHSTQNKTLFMLTAAMGCALGALFVATDSSLVAVMIAHATVNGISMLRYRR